MTQFAAATQTKLVVVIATADANATAQIDSNNDRASATSEVLLGSPSRTVTPTATARHTHTPEPATATVRYYLNLTHTRHVIQTATSLVRTQTQSAVNIQRTQTKQISNQLTQVALANQRATATALRIEQRATSIQQTQTRAWDNIIATIEVMSGLGTRTRTETFTRRPTNTITQTYTRTISPTRTESRTITLTPTASNTRTPSYTITTTPTKVVFNNGSTTSTSDIAGIVLSADESLIYGFTRGDPATAVLPSLISRNTSDLSVNSTDDIPMLTASLITRNINDTNQIGIVGKMNSNTIALQLYDTSSGSAVPQGAWFGTSTDTPQVVRMTGRYAYIGMSVSNPSNPRAPFGRLIMLDISNPSLPVQVGNAIPLTGPPNAITAIANSEFRLIVAGNTMSKKMVAQGYITSLKTNGQSLVINRTYVTSNPIADVVVRSSQLAMNRTHTIYAAISGVILTYSINEFTLEVKYMYAIKQPVLQYKHLQLSQAGSYLYAIGIESLMDMNALVAYDVRTIPQFRGYFGQFANNPQQLLVGASQLFLISENQIFATPSISALSGIQSVFGPQ
jgi:hypothetical protein